MNNPEIKSINELRSHIGESHLFIFAAGYEERSQILPSDLENLPQFGAIAVTFRRGPSENFAGKAISLALLGRLKELGRFSDEVEYYPDLFVEFEDSIDRVLNSICNTPLKSVCVDVSGMPQFVIMRVLAALRGAFPEVGIVCVYVAAKSYPPSDLEIKRFLDPANRSETHEFDFGLTFEPADTLFPKRFAGVGQRRGRSVMVLFAGYEKDRSHAAYDAINPGKLIIIHSEPAIDGGAERLVYSRAVHEELGGRIDKAVEVLSNLDVKGHLETLRDYYNWMYDLYDFVLVPVHSKMQAIACYLFVEEFPDVQVIFPVPVEYKVDSGGLGVGTGYLINIPLEPRMRMFGNI